jgi:transcriptional regulator
MYCRFPATTADSIDIANANPFATLTTSPLGGDSGDRADSFPRVAHVPLFVEAPSSLHPNGVVWGHVAKNNPQWRSLEKGVSTCAAFRGPHAYVSSRWLAEKETAVPTWNYSAASAFGIPELVSSKEEALLFMKTLSAIGEGYLSPKEEGDGFKSDDLQPAFLDMHLGNIRVFKMPVEWWDGTRKLSQNKTVTERTTIADGLQRIGTDNATHLAQTMRAQVAAEAASAPASKFPVVENPSSLPVFSAADVAAHASEDDAWVVIDGYVYDVTKWLQGHPGGPEVLVAVAGKDGTERYLSARHSPAANKRATKYLKGRLANA